MINSAGMDNAGYWAALPTADRDAAPADVRGSVFWQCDGEGCPNPPARQLKTPGGMTLFFCSEGCFDGWWRDYAAETAEVEMLPGYRLRGYGVGTPPPQARQWTKPG